MSKYNFLIKLLEMYWQQPIGNKGAHKWSLRECIKRLSADELICLVELYCECYNLDVPEDVDIVALSVMNEDCPESPIAINQELIIQFIKILSVSEFRIDDMLYHPPKMRNNELSAIAESIGVNSKVVHSVYLSWHGGIRKKVYGG